MDESAKNPQKRKNNYLKNKERIEKLKFERNQRRKTEHEKNEEIKDGQYEKNNKFKKYGLCVGYIGSRYHGCQGQGKEHMTIENEIERTLTKINAVKNNSKGFNYCLSRSARTDLGVHALYNLFVYNINIDVCEGENGNDNSKPENGLVNNQTNSPKCDKNNEENPNPQNVSENNNSLNTNNDKKNNTFEERKRKEKKFINLLNSNLPNDIKCFDIYKVTKSFDARKFCSFRLYEYLFPTYVLSPVQVVPKYEKIFEECVKHIDEYVENHKEAKKKKKENEKEKRKQHDEENDNRIDKPDEENDNKIDNPDEENDTKIDNPDEENDTKIDKPDEENKVEPKKASGKAWGLEAEDIFTIKEEKSDLTDDELNNLFEIFSNYRGYHNFHCFTKNNIDTTTFRYIKYFDVSTVKLYDHNFISIRILGQSFLMHQIRKMITLAVETFRNATSKNSIYYSLNTKSYIPILLFPPDGLMLVCPYFNSYNEKVCNPPDTPQICFDENEEILNFKKDQIGKSIIEKINQNVWKDWMVKINKYPFIYHFMKTKIEEEKTETNS